jgi:hypothetical protein
VKLEAPLILRRLIQQCIVGVHVTGDPIAMIRYFKLKPSVVHEKFGDETVIVSLDSGSYYSAQGTGGVIWNLVSEGSSERNIVRHIRAEFNGDSDEISRATANFLDQLIEESLVSPEYVDDGDGSSLAHSVGKPDQVFVTPLLQKYTDMEEMLMLDPIHEVDEQGWPSTIKPPEA